MKKYLFIFLLCLIIWPLTAQDEVKEGFNKFFYPNGQVSSEGIIREGKPDGYWRTYYVTGILKSEGLRTNFQLDSTWTFYNQSGNVEERIDYKYGKRNGYSFKYSYVNSLQAVVISKELFVNDKKEGKAYYYYPNGNLKEEVSYSNGKKQGSGKEYDEKSNVITIFEHHNNYLISRQRINRNDSQGRKQGSWMEFYTSGKIKKEMTYVDDLLYGLYK